MAATPAPPVLPVNDSREEQVTARRRFFHFERPAATLYLCERGLTERECSVFLSQCRVTTNALGKPVYRVPEAQYREVVETRAGHEWNHFERIFHTTTQQWVELRSRFRRDIPGVPRNAPAMAVNNPTPVRAPSASPEEGTRNTRRRTEQEGQNQTSPSAE